MSVLSRRGRRRRRWKPGPTWVTSNSVGHLVPRTYIIALLFLILMVSQGRLFEAAANTHQVPSKTQPHDLDTRAVAVGAHSELSLHATISTSTGSLATGPGLDIPLRPLPPPHHRYLPRQGPGPSGTGDITPVAASSPMQQSPVKRVEPSPQSQQPSPPSQEPSPPSPQPSPPSQQPSPPSQQPSPPSPQPSPPSQQPSPPSQQPSPPSQQSSPDTVSSSALQSGQEEFSGSTLSTDIPAVDTSTSVPRTSDPPVDTLAVSWSTFFENGSPISIVGYNIAKSAVTTSNLRVGSTPVPTPSASPQSKSVETWSTITGSGTAASAIAIGYDTAGSAITTSIIRVGSTSVPTPSASPDSKSVLTWSTITVGGTAATAIGYDTAGSAITTSIIRVGSTPVPTPSASPESKSVLTWSTITVGGTAATAIGYDTAGLAITTSIIRVGSTPVPSPSASPESKSVTPVPATTATPLPGRDFPSSSMSAAPVDKSVVTWSIFTKSGQILSAIGYNTAGLPITTTIPVGKTPQAVPSSSALPSQEYQSEVNFERTESIQGIITRTSTTMSNGTPILQIAAVDNAGKTIYQSTRGANRDRPNLPEPATQDVFGNSGSSSKLVNTEETVSGRDQITIRTDGSPSTALPTWGEQENAGRPKTTPKRPERPRPGQTIESTGNNLPSPAQSKGAPISVSPDRGQLPSVPLPLGKLPSTPTQESQLPSATSQQDDLPSVPAREEQLPPLPSGQGDLPSAPPQGGDLPSGSSQQRSPLPQPSRDQPPSVSTGKVPLATMPSENKLPATAPPLDQPTSDTSAVLPDVTGDGNDDMAPSATPGTSKSIVRGPLGSDDLAESASVPSGNNRTLSEDFDKPKQALPATTSPAQALSPERDTISAPTEEPVPEPSSAVVTPTQLKTEPPEKKPPQPPEQEPASSESSRSDPYAWVPSSTLIQNPSASATEPEAPQASQDEVKSDLEDTFIRAPEAADEAEKPEDPKADEPKAVLPSEWPSSIIPQQDATELEDGEESRPVGLAGAVTSRRPADTSLVSILFTKALSWSWLLSQSDASAQVFAYMPLLITSALGIDRDAVITVSLEAWEPPNWSGDGADVRSVWVGHMPTKKVDYLAALLANTSSELYNSAQPVIKQLSSCIDPSLPVLSLQNSLGLDPAGAGSAVEDGNPNAGNMSNKTTAFVASAAALGAIVVAVGAFFGSRYAMKKRAQIAANTSRYSASNSSFSSRRQFRSEHDYGSPAAPMDRADYPRDSEYYGTQSEYPVTERDSMRDTYASRPPTGPLPDPPEEYRQSVESRSIAHVDRNGASSYYPTERSYGPTARSGSGSSVQSEILGTRQVSMEIPIRDTWWKHASQWNDPSGQPEPTRGNSVMSDPVPKSGRIVTLERPFSASTYSTLRTAEGGRGGGFSQAGPFGHGTPFSQRLPSTKPSKISAPYLQDNSLML